MMRAYTTFAGASRAAGGSPIVRLLADPVELFVIEPNLDTRIMILTAGSPRGNHEFAGSMSAMDIIDVEIERKS